MLPELLNYEVSVDTTAEKVTIHCKYQSKAKIKGYLHWYFGDIDSDQNVKCQYQFDELGWNDVDSSTNQFENDLSITEQQNPRSVSVRIVDSGGNVVDKYKIDEVFSWRKRISYI